MLSTRRSTILLGSIATCFFLLLALQDRVIPQARPIIYSTVPTSYSSNKRCPASPPSKVVDTKIKGFRWRDVAPKWPVEITNKLPSTHDIKLPRIQYDFSKSQEGGIQEKRRHVVKQAFMRGWKEYKKNAWLHDEIAPVSGGHKDSFGGWGATLVDSLGTLWIMDLKLEFIEAVTAAANITFDPDSSSLEYVNMFETTIRYLGGFLAAYDLTDCKDERLLRKAVEMGDMIYASYDTPNRMPITRWNIRNHKQHQLAAENGIIAELASASLEFTRLSQLTGEMRYYDAVARITNVLSENQNKTRLPGMFPTAISTREQDFSAGAEFGFGAMADSAYEYFGKTWQLLGGKTSQYKKLYEDAMNVASSHLLYRPSTPDQADILVPATWHADAQTRDNQFQHLSCFAGGMYLLGGRLFENETHVEIGKRLTDGCAWAYKNAPLGIMPEIVDMTPCPSLEACPYNHNQPSPFTSVGDPKYILRPEAIESIFYAYRITGDETYRDIAWDMFIAIDKHTKVRHGNAAIKDVMQSVPEHEDSAESFWFSETLKYFYLIFSGPDLVSLDEWVFNTEAHPFRVPKG